MCPAMKNVNTLAAAPIENVLTGLDFEFLPWDAWVTLYASVSAVTASIGFKADSVAILADGSVPNVASSAGVVQKDRDVIFSGQVVPANTRLKLRAVGTAAAETLNWWVEVDQIREIR